MIRAACNCGGLAYRTVAFVKSQSNNPRVSPLRFLSAAAPRVQLDKQDDNGVLPPNLTFDRRSSFAPKVEPVLVAPDLEGDISDDEDGEAEETENYDEDDDEDVNVTDSLGEPRYAIPLPDRLKTDIHYGLDGSVTGSLWLEPSVFGADPIRVDLIKQSVDYIRNKIRGRRKAKTKTISEKRGSGRKVRPQKGSGRARAGHSRPAHWRGGAKAHGPKNTVDYGDVKMNKKARRLAIISTLSQKLKEGNLIIVDNLNFESHKTSKWSALLESAYGIGKEGSSALILDHYYEPEQGDENDSTSYHASFKGVPINLWVASSNLYKMQVANQRFANVYDILKKDKLILTLSALEQIESRWKD